MKRFASPAGATREDILSSPSTTNAERRRAQIFHLRRVFAEGYKALDPVNLELREKLLFLIGSNGAGKSSTLQALAFVQFFAMGKPDDFFAERQWNPADVKSRTVEKPHNTLRYHLLFQRDDGVRLLWQFAWGLNSRALIAEKMWFRDGEGDLELLFDFNHRTRLKGQIGDEIRGLLAQGSVLALMDVSKLTSRSDQVREVVDWCVRITSLELLSPVAMRSNVRGSPQGIGTRGQRLSGFLASVDSRTKARIVDRLSDFYPLDGLTTARKKAGWIDLKIAESYGIGAISAQHTSDGFLRLLALCAVPEFGSRSSLVLLDEIEDGIEPHVLPRIIERIVRDSSAQFVMTSHSPLLVNFFDSESITLVTRSPEGRSRFIPVDKLRTVKSGLEYFGPGEIWANSGLETLNSDAAEAVAASLEDGERVPSEKQFTTEWAKYFMDRP